MRHLPATDLTFTLNGSFPRQRTHTPDPLLPVDSSEVQRQVSKWSSRSARLLTDSKSA